jgi:hypothetical protein
MNHREVLARAAIKIQSIMIESPGYFDPFSFKKFINRQPTRFPP